MIYAAQGEVVDRDKEAQQVTDNFYKRALVIKVVESGKDGATFENYMAFEFTGKRINEVQDIRIGYEVEVKFAVRCNKPKDRWFVSLNGISATPITRVNKERDDEPVSGQPQGPSDEDDDQLPF